MANDLSPEKEKSIQVQVSTGAFASRDAAIDAGIDLLRKHDGLVNRIQESRRQLDAGEFTEYDEESLKARFGELRAKAENTAGE